MVKHLKMQIVQHFNNSDDHNLNVGLSWYERAHKLGENKCNF